MYIHCLSRLLFVNSTHRILPGGDLHKIMGEDIAYLPEEFRSCFFSSTWSIIPFSQDPLQAHYTMLCAHELLNLKQSRKLACIPFPLSSAMLFMEIRTEAPSFSIIVSYFFCFIWKVFYSSIQKAIYNTTCFYKTSEISIHESILSSSCIRILYNTFIHYTNSKAEYIAWKCYQCTIYYSELYTSLSLKLRVSQACWYF